MAGDVDQDQKTEQPTRHKREEARREGQVCVSRELTSSLLLAVFFAYFSYQGEGMLNQICAYMQSALTSMRNLPSTNAQISACVAGSIWEFLRIIGPFFAVMASAAVLINVAQTGPLFAPQKLMPRFDKLSPSFGIKKICGPENFVQLAFGLLKLAVVARGSYQVIRESVPDILMMHAMDIHGVIGVFFSLIMHLGTKICFLLVLIGLLDYAYQRWQFEKGLRMSKEEVRDELKRFEGDAQIKARIKGIQASLSRQRMMKAVPGADVVITNPTHLAVAIKYDAKSMGAPEVVAKGARLIAARIREIAVENAIPIVENKPLARAIFKNVGVGQQIPQKFYQAVAEILAYVYQLNRHKLRESGLGVAVS